MDSLWSAFADILWYADSVDDPGRQEPEVPCYLDDIIRDGCLIERSRLKGMLKRWRSRNDLTCAR